jgi:dipeptidase
VTNLVANLTYDRWSRIFPDVQKAQAEQEERLLKMQPVIEETAAKLVAADPALAKSFLTNYSVSTAEALFRRWQELAQEIIAKNIDGYVKVPNARSRADGYSEEWLRHVVESRPEQFKLPETSKPVETDH